MTNLNLFFSTPVWASKIDGYKETNEKIYDYIKKLNDEDNLGISRSNKKGWHSKDFNMSEEKPKMFINLISSALNQTLSDMNWDLQTQTVKITSMWAIINNGGASNDRHHHGNSTISAAYYVRAPKNCGDIVFYDPRPAPVYFHPHSKKANSLNCVVNSIEPEEGLLVLFPGYLDHSVNENFSNKERMVISFNLTLFPK
tara:strand:- start:147 stop:743 length:597 start_codon:yes stop_codon:yes gene_type:complete